MRSSLAGTAGGWACGRQSRGWTSEPAECGAGRDPCLGEMQPIYARAWAPEAGDKRSVLGLGPCLPRRPHLMSHASVLGYGIARGTDHAGEQDRVRE
jgi:hypothetical protein